MESDTRCDLTGVIRARVKPELKQRVSKIARRRKSDESSVIREAVSQFLEKQEVK